MPSKAFKTFETKLVTEVERLIDTHGYLSDHHYKGRQGRRGLGHVTRSGIVMLCAGWERYIELAIRETADHLSDRATTPKDLPTDVQKELAKYVKTHKDELRALDLAGDGWEAIYGVVVEQKTASLNTPKSTKIDLLCKQLLGIPQLSDCWSAGATDVDDFVTTRGGIAHTGSAATYVTVVDLRSNRDLICEVVRETDNRLTEFVKGQFPNHNVPWQRRN